MKLRKLDHTVSDSEVHIAGYETVRRDRSNNGRHGGGVSIYIRNNHNYQIRKDLMDDQLELITIEICRQRSKPFLISTWYRPPNSLVETFERFEHLLEMVDSTDLDYYLLGDFNCDIKHLDRLSSHSRTLMNILDVYGLQQLIDEPTRVTENSSTLIDLCLTNVPDKTPNYGVIHTGISDHSMVYMTRKCRYAQRVHPKICQVRNFKNFKEEKYLDDLGQMNWSDIEMYDDPNEMWSIWKAMLMHCIDSNVPLKNKRIGKLNSAPWITKDLLVLMRERDSLKRSANISNDIDTWNKYKRARNLTNNAVRLAKKKIRFQVDC